MRAIRGEPVSLGLEDTIETLLFGFSWDGRGRFVMVTEIGPPPAARRALARFVFDRVERFERARGTLPGMGEALVYRLDAAGRPFVVHDVRKRGDLLHVSFGPELGGVAFGSTRPQVEQLLLDSWPDGAEWRYALHGTRDELDLFAVFGTWK